LAGTQAAQVTVSAGINPNIDAVNVYIKNTRPITAKIVRVRFTITRKTLREQKPLGEPIVKTIERQRLSQSEDAIGESYKIPKFGPEGWDAMNHLQQTVWVEWDVSYDNGFGDTVSGKECRFYIFMNFKVEDGRVVGAPGGLYNCASIDQFLDDALKSKSIAEAEAEKQRQRPN
jgi:hypothetical protein